MKKLHVYKKYYRGVSWEKIFNGALSLILILETNLISHTLGISTISLVLIGVLVVGFLLASVLVRVHRLNEEIQSDMRKIVSDNAARGLKIVRKYGGLPIIPLFFVILVNKDNLILFWLLISILLLLIVKCFLDDIITFKNDGYSSGFDEIELDSNCRIELKKTKIHPLIGEIFYIELYRGDNFLGYDKLVQADYLYAISSVKNRE